VPDDLAQAKRAAAWRRAHHEEIDDGAALAFHVRAAWGLERALRRLDEAGVPTLVVKGALLAHLLYESPIERPILDVDIRMRGRDLARATRALLAVPDTRLKVSSAVYGNAVFSLRGVEIDVETTIGPRFVCAIGVEEMLARAEEAVEPLGFRHVRPETHDHALLLAINLFKDHALPDAPTAEDLVRIARLASFRVEALAERARAAGCTTLVHVVARHLASTRDDARWAEIAVAVPPARAAYAESVVRALGDAEGSLLGRAKLRAAADGRLRQVAAVLTAGAYEATRALAAMRG
jgi:hypothetical protein